MTQILTDIFYFYRKNFVALISYIIPVSLFMSSVSLWLSDFLANGQEMDQVKYLIVINFLFNPIYLGGLLILLSALSRNTHLSLMQCLNMGIYKWPALFLVSILYGSLTGLGLFMFIIPGIWIFMRLILSSFLVVLNDQKPLDAIQNSFKVTQPEFWNITGTTLLIFLSLILIQQSLISVIPDTAIMTILASVLGDLLWSLLTVLWFRFYDLLINNN